MTKRFIVDYENNAELFRSSCRERREECPSEAFKDWGLCGNPDSVEVMEPLADKCIEWLNDLPGADESHSYSSGPFLVQDIEDEPSEDGTETFLVYHKDEASNPELHEGGTWFYEPRKDSPINEVWSDGFESKKEALRSAREEETGTGRFTGIVDFE